MRNQSAFPFVLGVLAALCLSAAAQQPAAPPSSTDQPAATLKIQAREVVLPVTVRDKRGALVASLSIGDFTLTEDGRPQTIKSFTRQSNLPFRLGLLVDTSRSVTAAMDSERRAAGKFVDQMLPADPKAGTAADQAFLIHFDHEVELLRDLTSAREKLHSELDDMGPTRVSGDSSQGPETRDSDRGEAESRRRGGTQLYDAIYLACHEIMESQDGRKALVVFSDGADRGSRETLNDAIDAADHANVVVYTIYFKGEQENSGFGNGSPGGHRGGGYPGGGGGYPGGGGGYPGGGGRRGGQEPTSATGQDGKKIMERIAVRTGGRYFEAKKKDSLDEIYAQIAEELRGQYLLTYTPDVVDKEGGYHKIALKAGKDDLVVVTREGYYAPSGDQK
ncbi:MAG: VWA domain-containing protein [Terracidiphilus sp.]|nr:VWA domain-containing protein [Terracidiphilus sp.]